MKRSEMVEIIRLALLRWNGAFYDESLESYILSEIESEGMLPPFNPLSFFMDVDSTHSWETE